MRADRRDEELRQVPRGARPRQYLRSRFPGDLHWRFACWVFERPDAAGVIWIGGWLLVGIVGSSMMSVSYGVTIAMFGAYGIGGYAYTLTMMRRFEHSYRAACADPSPSGVEPR